MKPLNRFVSIYSIIYLRCYEFDNLKWKAFNSHMKLTLIIQCCLLGFNSYRYLMHAIYLM